MAGYQTCCRIDCRRFLFSPPILKQQLSSSIVETMCLYLKGFHKSNLSASQGNDYKLSSSVILMLPFSALIIYQTNISMEHFFFSSGRDRVYVCGSVTGTYAEFALCNASNVHLMPDNVSFSQGAAIYVPYYTAYRALFQRCGIQYMQF